MKFFFLETVLLVRKCNNLNENNYNFVHSICILFAPSHFDNNRKIKACKFGGFSPMTKYLNYLQNLEFH